MIRTPFLTVSIKVIFSFSALLLISSSQGDCSSDIYPSAVETLGDSIDIGSCFTHHQNGYLPALQRTGFDKNLAVTGSKYHF